MSTTVCPSCHKVNRSVAAFCVTCNASLPAPFAATEQAPTELLLDDRIAPTEYLDRADGVDREAADVFAATRLEGAAVPKRHFSDRTLPDGAVIEGFRILRPLGEGGFGIVYLAWDAALERHVAIKEYMPLQLAVRSRSLFEVSVRNERDRATFEAGLKSFVNEARLLARFDHPALVKVFRFWEGNGTAYMAMPFYEGPTLKTALAGLGGPPSEAQLRAWLDPLLDAMSVLHAEQCFHRDIAPDNILLTAGGPLLLDFGAARRVIGDQTQALTAFLKPDFAPIEQYGGAMLQGPWTDLYALAGVVHYAIVGRPPVASAGRVVRDTLEPLTTRHAGRYGAPFLRAIDAALAIRPEQRPQDVAQFRAMLDAPLVVVPGAVDAPVSQPVNTLREVDVVKSEVREVRDAAVREAVPERGRRSGVAIAAVVVLALVGVVAWQGLEHRSLSSLSSSAAAKAPEVVATPAPAAPATPAAPPTADPTPTAPMAASAPTPAVEAVPSAPATTHASATPTPSAEATPRPSTEPPRHARTAAASAPAPAPRLAAAEPEAAAPAAPIAAATATAKARPQRCADIVQKSSLEPLAPDEIAFLKKECR